MRLLGIIKKIEGKPRTWTNQNGETVYAFKMAFEAEGNQFFGEYVIAPQRLAQLGIRPGAVGYMDLRFSIRDFDSKNTGEKIYVQQVNFSKWSLANQTPQEAAPTQDPQPAAEPAPAADPESDAIEGENDPENPAY